ncbi:MAG: xanthine dehydrogenase family protein subunit M [Desulfomonile tiedjei]|nr:xanthine dehydrogenase family protein subunit M [Desulfomonile tiedjei]
MRTFEYLKPTSVEDALSLLAQYGDKAKVIAGGTDVMVQWKKKLISAEYLISLRNIPALNFIDLSADLRIGSATPHRALELSPVIQQGFPAIHDAVRGLGSVQVRNSGTIGGNLCNAAPSADTAPPMLVLDTEVKISSAGGTRSVRIEEFFKGPGKTVLETGDLVTEFVVPKPASNTGMAYWKHTRRKAMDLPILGVAMLLSFDDDLKTCQKARIGLGVAAPVPLRARKAEAFLEGRIVDEAALAEAGKLAAAEASPRTTIRGSEWYRRDMIGVLVKRTGLICQQRARR